jgi:hypothetical protein
LSGECGSVVVDTAANKVYGHVVGSDPLGHAYVVPLAHVLQQIANCFGGEAVPRFAVCDSGQDSPKAQAVAPGALLTTCADQPANLAENLESLSFSPVVHKPDEEVKELRSKIEQATAHMAGLSNENQVLAQEIASLIQANKNLVEQNSRLQESITELEKASHKSSGSLPPSASSATASELSDEKKVRQSSSRRPEESRTDKDKERERRDKKVLEMERALQEETERLRKRFDLGRNEGEAKSNIGKRRISNQADDQSFQTSSATVRTDFLPKVNSAGYEREKAPQGSPDEPCVEASGLNQDALASSPLTSWGEWSEWVWDDSQARWWRTRQDAQGMDS